MKWIAMVVIATSMFAAAQVKEPSAELQLKLMKAQRHAATENAKLAELNQKFQAVLQSLIQGSAEAKDLQKQAAEVQQRIEAARKEFESDKTEAYKQAGLSTKEWDFDEGELEFTRKKSFKESKEAKESK